jgi:hypothetical protein
VAISAVLGVDFFGFIAWIWLARLGSSVFSRVIGNFGETGAGGRVRSSALDALN